jgi:hypothetical protein
MLSHLVLSTENGRKNKFKTSILTLKITIFLDVVSIFTFSHERLDRLSSGTSHFVGNTYSESASKSGLTHIRFNHFRRF